VQALIGVGVGNGRCAEKRKAKDAALASVTIWKKEAEVSSNARANNTISSLTLAVVQQGDSVPELRKIGELVT
jgi:hypothetical protein